MAIDGVDTTYLVHLEIRESESHAAAVRFLERNVLTGKEELAITPQVLQEFIHIVTDPRRFEQPLSMGRALERAEFWWQAREVHRVLPCPDSTDRALRWMNRHDLGRKRILDTFIAATYLCAGIHRIVTTNARDYSLLEGITPIVPGKSR